VSRLRFQRMILAGVPVFAARAATAQEAPTADPLAAVEVMLTQGDIQGAKESARTLAGSPAATIETVLGALDVMARACQQSGDAASEIGCYEQIGALDWLTRVTMEKRLRMLTRLEAIAGGFEKAPVGKPHEVVDLCGRILELRAPLKWDATMVPPAKANQLALRLHGIRARAYGAMGDRAKAQEEGLAAMNTRAFGMFAQRWEAAQGVVAGLTAQDRPATEKALRQGVMTDADDDSAFLAQAAVMQSAMDAKDWPAAARASVGLFLLCPRRAVTVDIFMGSVQRLSNDADRAGYAVPMGREMRAYLATGPKGPDGQWDTADDASFPLLGVRNDTPSVEKDELQAALKAVQDAEGPASATAGKSEAARMRSRLRLLLREHDKALSEAYAAYRAASRGRTAQVEAACAFAMAAQAASGRFLSSDRFILFAAFGPQGRDGIQGTADDLKDPFAEYLPKGTEP
jgi:hypothetical protein